MKKKPSVKIGAAEEEAEAVRKDKKPKPKAESPPTEIKEKSKDEVIPTRSQKQPVIESTSPEGPSDSGKSRSSGEAAPRSRQVKDTSEYLGTKPRTREQVNTQNHWWSKMIDLTMIWIIFHVKGNPSWSKKEAAIQH